MNNITGMSISEFNKIIEEMKSIYPFQDNKAFLGNLHDMLTNGPNQVEVITNDEKTGIRIVMAKKATRENYEAYKMED